jgi:multiple sugar transport system substrate-binding protein
MVDFYHVEGEGLLGLPFAVYPSFMFVNLDLFDEAGLPYPPQEYGAPYVDENGEEHEWNIETLTMLAKKLTVDGNGNDANSPDFDANSIVQFGFGEQFTDARGVATLFGSGSLVDGDGNANVPDHWREAWNWVYKAMWEDYFYPNAAYGGSDLLAAGNWFESGNMAMVHTHLWYAGCCMGNYTGNWDTAAVPSYNGMTTAKMHADTFEIMKSTKHPKEAFEVMAFFTNEAANDLAQVYGGMPARLSLQGDFLAQFAAEKHPDQDVNWQVVADSMSYADNPNHESYLPSLLESADRYNEFWNLAGNESDLDLDAEIDKLEVDLQRIYDAAK